MKEGTTMLQRINNTIGRISIAGDETSWDFGFLESLKEQMEKGSTLSPRQTELLGEIEGRWSDEALAARATWQNEWNEEKAEKFAIALRYYQKTGYYSNIVHKYMLHTGEIGGIPLEKEYNKLVLNKYAAGVIRNIQSEGKFPVGSSAVFRSTLYGDLRNKPVIILKYGDADTVQSHAKGAKPVQVLPIGSSDPLWTEERHLKKAQKRKVG